MDRLQSVLLIDDDEINNFLNKRLLHKLGIAHEVKVVMNGAEGIKYIEKISNDGRQCPELILLDINMPVMNGFEFLEAYDKLSFENKEKVVLVVLTTSTNFDDMQMLKNLKAKELLNKPLTEEKIMYIVKDKFNEKD
ncbi:MAG TPA: response regulator [Cytophagales bacterium]|nr:response regulator [Cytophagales bacterium]